MKKLLTITILLLLMVGCKKEEGNPCTFFVRNATSYSMDQVIVIFGNDQAVNLSPELVGNSGEEVFLETKDVQVIFMLHDDANLIARVRVECGQTVSCTDTGVKVE